MPLLTLLLGRSQSGKSTNVLKQIQERGQIRKQILLVPEQASYETERKLCEINGNAASQYAEVFSFTSLSHRVEALFGGLARPVLDEGGRLLVMYRALKAVSSKLSVFGPLSQKPEFLTQLLSAIDELKSSCVTAPKLQEIADLADGLSAKKLQDMALIYGAYDSMTAHGASDPRDRLTRLSEKLESSPFAVGKDCYFDGFTDFTPQEERVIQNLLLRSESVTIVLTCDSLNEEDDPEAVFSSARHTAQTLLRMAKQNHVPVEVQQLNVLEQVRHPALTHLEQYLFSPEQSPYAGDPTNHLSVFSARNRREEVSWAANQIRSLLRSGQVRCRDIAVAARDLEAYRDLISSEFARYRIPVFQSSMQSILQKPVFSVIISALDVLTGNYAYEDMFRYLKTGLANLSPEECDSLENYVLLWNIRGKQWTSKVGFQQSPSGYGSRHPERDQTDLSYLNKIRCKVISPFEQYLHEMSDSAISKVTALYNFLENIHLAEHLEQRANALLARGEPELALEYQQLWDILCSALQQCAETLGDEAISLEEFSRLLRLLFSQYTVGAIPASLDRVITGDLPRLANRRVKVLILLGAEENSLPKVSEKLSLWSEEERELFLDYGITLSPGLEAQMNREMTILYEACAQPSEYFLVSWPMAGDGGSERYPSMLIHRLQTLFPNLLERSLPADPNRNDPSYLKLLALEEASLFQRLCASSEYQPFVARMEAASLWRRGQLSASSVENLYGTTMALSPSRLDQYKSCRFSYFLKFGMQAKPRKSAGFHAPEYGTFVHYILEFVLREAKHKGPIKDLGDAELNHLIQTAISRYAKEQLGGLEGQTPRFRYLFQRLRRSVTMVVQNVVEELRSSDFQPIFFELGFGTGKELPPVELREGDITLSISGFIDRVDGWVKDGKLYLKIVDYKTGRKSFDLTEIWNGLGLQMLLYLFALEEHAAFFEAEEIVPAGVLYLPARDVLIAGTRTMPDEQRRKLIEKELTRKGLILDDPAVLEALEFPQEAGYRFLPLRVTAKTKALTSEALVSAEKLGKLKQHIQTILREICVEMRQGVIGADPYWRGPNKNACLYCDYALACHFDETLGEDHKRWLPTIRNSDFWKQLEDYMEGESDGWQ